MICALFHKAVSLILSDEAFEELMTHLQEVASQ